MNNLKNIIPIEWWKNDYFFGERYYYPDNSKEGYLFNKKETLEQRTVRECAGIINLTNLSINSRILDAPCGYGRHSIYLSDKKYILTGIDINDDHLEKAKSYSANINPKFINKDLRNIGVDLFNSFDLVINMFYSFGFFQDDCDNLKVMNQFYNSLKVGGNLLLHTDVSSELIKNNNTIKESIRTLENNDKLIILEDYNSNNKRMGGSWETTNSIGEVYIS